MSLGLLFSMAEACRLVLSESFGYRDFNFCDYKTVCVIFTKILSILVKYVKIVNDNTFEFVFRDKKSR